VIKQMAVAHFPITLAKKRYTIVVHLTIHKCCYQMPVCSFFLRGVCTKDDCPYLHVYVGKDAEICLDFAKGYCPNGTKVQWLYLYCSCYESYLV